MNIFGALRERGYDKVPETYYSHINTWKSWYDGNVKGFHDFRVFNGQSSVKCRRYTMGMGKKVSEDWANLLMNEKVRIALDGEKEQAFVDRVLRDNNFAVKANEMQEIKAALGTAAYVFRVTGAETRGENGEVTGRTGDIRIDYVDAGMVIPLTWENRRAKECAFASPVASGTERYVYLQIHKLNNGLYEIENAIYRVTGESLTETDLNSVPGFESIAPVVKTGSDKPLFVLDRLNLANNIDEGLPMGVAVFANAIDQLKGVDIAYDSYVNEFVLGKKRIMVKPAATKTLDGEALFDEKDLTFYILPEDSGDGEVIREIDMKLRTTEHSAGIQDMLTALSAKCGFGERHYKFDSGSVATATQVISENSTLFRTIKKHEIVLEDVLVEVCRTILRLGNSIQNAGLNEETKISVQFDDSIIEDRQTKLQMMRADVAANLLRPELYVMEAYGVSEEEALKMMPGMEEITDREPSGEVE